MYDVIFPKYVEFVVCTWLQKKLGLVVLVVVVPFCVLGELPSDHHCSRYPKTTEKFDKLNEYSVKSAHLPRNSVQ
jgi:hypothetical protein